MKYAVEVGSHAMIYIPSFIKIYTGIQKLLQGIQIQTHRQQCDLISTPLFSQTKESRLKYIYIITNLNGCGHF
jgi:hypothetical protein